MSTDNLLSKFTVQLIMSDIKSSPKVNLIDKIVEHRGKGMLCSHHPLAMKAFMAARSLIMFTKVVVCILILVTLVYGGYRAYTYKKALTQSVETYSAVFLSNGQVYFGKVQPRSMWIKDKIILTEIFYPKFDTPVQPDTNSDTKTSTADSKVNVSLIKLGNELHGPEDKMVIEKNNVLFVEELKSDSKVVEAIKSYTKK